MICLASQKFKNLKTKIEQFELEQKKKRRKLSDPSSCRL